MLRVPSAVTFYLFLICRGQRSSFFDTDRNESDFGPRLNLSILSTTRNVIIEHIAARIIDAPNQSPNSKSRSIQVPNELELVLVSELPWFSELADAMDRIDVLLMRSWITEVK